MTPAAPATSTLTRHHPLPAWTRRPSICQALQ
jgi:hypothetical protein